ncbi:MAG: ATP-binding cassette domain-containing protein [Deltaproteobacteria bacterium]
MIRCEGLTKRFGELTAVREASLEVDAGQICGLVGPDGAGKTTLLRMLCGLIKPDGGQVWLDGIQGTAAVHEKLGYMPQNFSLYPDLSVKENINIFAAMYHLDRITVRKRADEILDMTRLAPFTSRLAKQLSGGMKQKLALSIALITRPAILLLDEPTYGVDPESRKEFWQILYNLNGSGMTILMSTPYMDEAELCHRVALISQGEIVAFDSPAALKSRLGGRLLEIRVNVKDPALFHQLAAVQDSTFFGDHYRLLVEEPDAGLPAIEDYLRKQNLSAEIRPATPSMEDVFIFLAESDGR